MGWGWGKTRYQLWSYLLPVMAGLAVYGIVWGTGWGGFSSEGLTGAAGTTAIFVLLTMAIQQAA